MSNPIRNAMVYLGLADESEGYEASEAPDGPAPHAPSTALAT